MPAFAATDFYTVQHNIEGNRVADLNWGTANAEYAVLRFVASTSHVSVGRSFSVSLRNSAANMSLVLGPFVSAISGAWKEFSVVVPPCTTGAWSATTGIGVSVTFVIGCGVNFQTANTGIWQSGNFLAPPDANIGNWPTQFWSLVFGEVGLYPDPNMTGVAPPFQQQTYEDDLADCQRYWYRGGFGLRGVVSATTLATRLTAPHPVTLRIPPAISLVGTTLRAYDAVAAPAITGVTSVANTTQHLEISATTTGLTVGRVGGILVDSILETTAAYVAVNARM